jgi:hypothetical protein
MPDRLHDPGTPSVDHVRHEYRANGRQGRQQLRAAPARERERVQGDRWREHRDGPGRAIDMQQQGNERAGQRKRPRRPAATSPQRGSRRQAKRNRQRPGACAAVQELSDDDHRADEHRHGSIDQEQVATVHGEANLAPAPPAGIPQRE